MTIDATRLFSWFIAGSTFWAIIYAVTWTPIFISLILAVMSERKHNANTCPHCIFSIPTDAAFVAKQKDKQLRYWHWEMSSFWTALGPSVVLLGLALGFTITFYGSGLAYIGSVFLVIFWLNRWYSNYCIITHQTLKSFCPYCKGGGWSVDPIGTPDPSGVKSV